MIWFRVLRNHPCVLKFRFSICKDTQQRPAFRQQAGIDLKQAARQARENGYRLDLLDTLIGATFLLSLLREGGVVCAAAGNGRG
jgi:hypothetical protein